MDLKTKLERSLDNNWLETMCISSGDGKVDFALPPYHPSDNAKVRGAKNVILKAINAGVSGIIPQDSRMTASKTAAGYLKMRHAMTETVPILVSDTLIYQTHALANTERHSRERNQSVQTTDWAYFNKERDDNGRYATIDESNPFTTDDVVVSGIIRPTPKNLTGITGTHRGADWETIEDTVKHQIMETALNAEADLRSGAANNEYNWNNGLVLETSTPGISRIAFLERTGYTMERINGRDDADALFVVRCQFNIRTLSPEYLHWVPDPHSGEVDTLEGNIESNIFLGIARAMATQGIHGPMSEWRNQNLNQFLEEMTRKQDSIRYIETLKDNLIEVTEVTDTIESCVVMNKRFVEIFSRLNYQTQGGRLQTSGYNSLRCGLYKDVSGGGALVNMVDDPEDVGPNPLLVRRYGTINVGLDYQYGSTRTVNSEFNWWRQGGGSIPKIPRPYTTALNPYNGYRNFLSAQDNSRQRYGLARMTRARQLPLSLPESADSDYEPVYRYLDTLSDWEYNTICAKGGVAFVRELVKPSLMTQLQWYAQNTTEGTMPIQKPLFVKNHGFGDGGKDGATEYYIKFQGIGEDRRRPTFSESIASMSVTQVLTKGTELRPFSTLREKALHIHNGAYTDELDELLAQAPEVREVYLDSIEALEAHEESGFEPVPWEPDGYPANCVWWRREGAGVPFGQQPETLLGLLERDSDGTFFLNVPVDLQISFRNSADDWSESSSARLVRILNGRYLLSIPECDTLDEYYAYLADALRAEIHWETLRIGSLADNWQESIDIDVATTGGRILTSISDEDEEEDFTFNIMRESRLNVAFEEE